MQKTLNVSQTVNSSQCEIYFIIDGRNELAQDVSSFDFEEELKTESFIAMGDLQEQERVAGITTSGTLTVYTGSPVINEYFEHYKLTGKLQTISVKTIQEDCSSTRGRRVVYYDDFKFLQNKQAGGEAGGTHRTETINVAFKAGRTVEDFRRI